MVTTASPPIDAGAAAQSAGLCRRAGRVRLGHLEVREGREGEVRRHGVRGGAEQAARDQGQGVEPAVEEEVQDGRAG